LARLGDGRCQAELGTGDGLEGLVHGSQRPGVLGVRGFALGLLEPRRESVGVST
jgi:hypothetical protein